MIINKKEPNVARHFQFTPPTFGSDKNPKPPSAWTKSLYYWWWEYLKRNTHYHELIDNGSDSTICHDFGDVRNKSFKDWWKEGNRCVYLFAEPLAKVTKLEVGDVISNDPVVLTLSLPLTLPKEHLRKRFEDYLKKHHSGKSGVQNYKSSQARYHFSGQPNLEALKRGLELYDLHIANPKLSLLEISEQLKWTDKIDSKKIHQNDIAERRASLNYQLKRHLKRTLIAIEATTHGRFPNLNDK